MGSKEFPPTVRCPCSSDRAFVACCGPKGVDGPALHAHTTEALRASGVDPAFVYAYERTHLVVTPHHRTAGVLSAADLDEWDDAVSEYREAHPAN